MRKLATILVSLVLTLSLLPAIMAVDVGIGQGITMETEEFKPLVWMCDHRVVIDDDVEPGRTDGRPVFSAAPETCECVFEACFTACMAGQLAWDAECEGLPCDGLIDEGAITVPQLCMTYCEEETLKFSCPVLKGYELWERHNNYAFEGEKIEWIVLAMDKNKIEQIQDVVATVGSSQGEGNEVEVECVELHAWNIPGSQIWPECNARILEEEIDQFDDMTMSYYECTLTIETPDSMYGEFWITVEADDGTYQTTMDENEYWFLNPQIALSIDGALDFGIVRPGTISYSDTLLVGNDADVGSGVTLDMFISGTDFYDPMSSGARCVLTNRLKLGNNYVAPGLEWGGDVCDVGFGDTDDHFCYFATSGAYDTQGDPRSDAEGYVPIVYGDTFSPDFYFDAEIIADTASLAGPYFHSNMLVPGAEMALTFKLALPEPCVGDFTDGSLYFWGEAV
jgi:hypothetical protein